MDNTLLCWISIIVIVTLGILAHFLYDLIQIKATKNTILSPATATKHIKPLGLFTAINESTWEHIKIAITPTLLWSLFDGYFYGANPNYFTAKLASLLILTFFIPLIFYSYTRLSHKPILIIDILTFIIAVIFAQLSFFAIITQPAVPYYAIYLSAIATFAFFGAYMTLTLEPLRNIIFKDPITGQYGFRAHRNFFKARQLNKKSPSENKTNPTKPN